MPNISRLKIFLLIHLSTLSAAGVNSLSFFSELGIAKCEQAKLVHEVIRSTELLVVWIRGVQIVLRNPNSFVANLSK
jgi:hypothetical protein